MTHICLYCVWKYNKDNLDILRIDLFVLEDRKYYFVRHLDVYQGKNAGNTDIHHHKSTTNNYEASY